MLDWLLTCAVVTLAVCLASIVLEEHHYRVMRRRRRQMVKDSYPRPIWQQRKPER